jgi:hypothetical protein
MTLILMLMQVLTVDTVMTLILMLMQVSTVINANAYTVLDAVIAPLYVIA